MNQPLGLSRYPSLDLILIRRRCEKAVKLMQADTWDQGLLEELSTAMVDASICGLGQAAPNPIRMVMKHFADEVSDGADKGSAT